MSFLTSPSAFLLDMDGVLVRGGHAIPGAPGFIEQLRSSHIPFLLLTNNAARTPEVHAARLRDLGIEIEAARISTSGMALADLLRRQHPHGSAHVLGGEGLVDVLERAGYSFTQEKPDYLVVGEGIDFGAAELEMAIQLVRGGAKLMVTSPDLTIPSPQGPLAAPGTWAAQIVAATGVRPTFAGKPSRAMFTTALERLGVPARQTCMVGDTLDTDIRGGRAAGCCTLLVLSGNTSREDLQRTTWTPDIVRSSVAEITLSYATRRTARWTATYSRAA